MTGRAATLWGCDHAQLSDGWHGVKAQLDMPLTRAVRAGKIAVGTKLFVFGAELAGKSSPVTPLELTEATEVHLKLSANSTRRAKWDAKVCRCAVALKVVAA